MAANMQHMAGGQMMPQQMRNAGANQLHQYVYQNLMQNTPPANGMSWQANVPPTERMGKTVNLITNITLAMNGVDRQTAADFGCDFERDMFLKSATKEEYETGMANKRMEYFRKRQQNEPMLQNNLNVNAQAQAQAQAMMSMQNQMGNQMGGQMRNQMGNQMGNQMANQMGRGMMQGPQQNFQQMGMMQNPQMQQQPQQQPQQVNMGMGMNMGAQGGRGISPGQQMNVGMPGAAPGQQQQPFPNEMARLAHGDKLKVAELAQKIMSQTPEENKNEVRMQLQQRLPSQQLAEFQQQGKDPLVWYYQNHAFQALKNNINKINQQQNRQAMQNPAQAAMMQQQQSQQSMQQQRQNMMNQQGQLGNDLTQLNAGLDGIKDQQMNGFMAQQAGQMVVPANNPISRNATPQSMNQNMPNQPGGPTQTPRPPPQQGMPQQQTPQQQQQNQQQLNLQQIKMNQQQAQLQAQAQMKQMQGQQGGMGGMPNQGMNNLNGVGPRPQGMNPMANQGMGGNMQQFGDQRFNQNMQRPNNQMVNNMLSGMSVEQRQAINGLPPDKLNEVLRKWQSTREVSMAGGQMNPGQMQNPAAQNQFARMNQGMQGLGGPGPQAMPQQPQQQPGAMPNAGQQQQMQGQRPGPPNGGVNRTVMMDSMDLPPQVLNQIAQLPAEVKKWRDLKRWLSQQGSNLAPNIRAQLINLQEKQFHLVMQRHGMQMQQGQNMPQNGPNVQNMQNPSMKPGMTTPGPAPGPQMGNMPPAMQQAIPAPPPQVLQVSPQEIAQVRISRPQFANIADSQIRGMIQQVKRQQWQAQFRTQQAQAAQAQGPPGMQTPMGMQPGQMQMQMQQQSAQMPPQPQQPPQAQPQPQPQPAQRPAQPPQQPQQQQQPAGPGAASQQSMIQANAQKQAEQMRNRQQQQQAKQAAKPSPAPRGKNQKKQSIDVAAIESNEATSQGNAQPAQPPKPGPQRGPGQVPTLTPQEVADLDPERRQKYEAFLKAQAAKATAQNAAQNGSNEANIRLRALAVEEKQQFVDTEQPINMSPQEYQDSSGKLRRLVVDMTKIARGLNKWYALTRDDARAKMFFRLRLRIVSQFQDGDKFEVLKDQLSIRSSELDNYRAMLESMAKDLAASVYGRFKPNAQSQPMTQQSSQQSSGQPTPLNAANLEKNAQAIKQEQQGKGGKASQQPPAAPTSSQPPFQIGGASSPQTWMGKAKEMNLQLPPSRKKPKLSTTGATPSPKTATKGSPELQRVTEPQPPPPPKPVFLCKDADCERVKVGFSTDKALQQHIEEEHTKPREDPIKFVGEMLASALGLEADGSPKKDGLTEFAPSMSAQNSKQGLTPGNLVATPKSQDGSMKRTASGMGKPSSAKAAAARAAEGKGADGPSTPMSDSWAKATIDPQALLRNLGFENGIPGVVSDLNAFRSLTPKDTPGSSKDGSSEPNSDISDGAALDIELQWQNLDTDLLLDLNNANLGEGLDAMIEPYLTDSTGGAAAAIDWDDIDVDFSKPFQMDTSLYSMPV